MGNGQKILNNCVCLCIYIYTDTLSLSLIHTSSSQSAYCHAFGKCGGILKLTNEQTNKEKKKLHGQKSGDVCQMNVHLFTSIHYTTINGLNAI